MKGKTDEKPVWSKTRYANLIRYIPSGKYYARIRVSGKLIVNALKTTRISVAKLRLFGMEKIERQNAEHQTELVEGNLTFGQALGICKECLKEMRAQAADESLSGSATDRVVEIWPDLKSTEIRKVTQTDSLNWAAKFGQHASPTGFNHTISVLRNVLENRISNSVRYDHPARFINGATSQRSRQVMRALFKS
jgi:hypothetical protein